jgi:putative ABC transport system substrate-binding protein
MAITRCVLLIIALSFTTCATVVYGQRPHRVPVVGLLALSAGPKDTIYEAIREGLRERGYVEGHDFRFEYRGAQGHVEQLQQLAEELVRIKVDVIVTGVEAAAQAAKQATQTIPIVAVTYDTDPVAAELIESYNRPRGNITGIYTRGTDQIAKQLELIKEVLPSISRMGLLWDDTSPAQHDSIMSAARALGITIEVIVLEPPYDVSAAFRAVRQAKLHAVMVSGGPPLYVQRSRIGALALENKVAAIGSLRDVTEAGGLLSYAGNIRDTFRRVAYYIDRLLKGAKPSDLPIEQSDRFELTVNLKTAKALGITIPQSVLLRADEVIR